MTYGTSRGAVTAPLRALLLFLAAAAGAVLLWRLRGSGAPGFDLEDLPAALATSAGEAGPAKSGAAPTVGGIGSRSPAQRRRDAEFPEEADGQEHEPALTKTAPQIEVRESKEDAAGQTPELGAALSMTVGEVLAGGEDELAGQLSGSSDEPLFTTDELAQLAQSGAVVDSAGRLIGGAHTQEGGIVDAPLPEVEIKEEGEEENQSSSAESEGDAPRYTGQARGYAMLYLMHPRARATVESELQNLLAAGVREVFLGVLTDGTFGKNFGYLAEVLRRFSARGRVITLLLYLTNGPAMRTSGYASAAGFNSIDAGEFRSRIRFNPETRAKFTAMVREVKPVLELNAALGPFNRNLVSVMLEDNLQFDSYRAMRELAAAVLGDAAEFVRNPCGNCYEGNDTDPLDDLLEMHSAGAVYQLRPGDGLTLDGEGLVYGGEGEEGITPDQALQLFQFARRRKLGYVGLWRAERQGLRGSLRLDPDERRYEVPSASQVQAETEILRAGLSRIETETEGTAADGGAGAAN